MLGSKMKGVPYPFGLVKSVLPCVVDCKVKLDRTVKNRVNPVQGLSYIYLYEKNELVETHLLSDYVQEFSTLQEIEEAFDKEIKLYDYIEIEYNSTFLREIHEYNKAVGEWYMTKYIDKMESLGNEESREKNISDVKIYSEITVKIEVEEVLKHISEESVTGDFVGDFQERMMEHIIEALNLDIGNDVGFKKNYQISTMSSIKKGDKILFNKINRKSN